MSKENRLDSGSRRLDTWKEIANYFARDERTVRRWEAGRGLPVHRVPGRNGAVYAYEAELSAWLQGSRTGDEAVHNPVVIPEQSARIVNDPPRPKPQSAGWLVLTAAMAVIAISSFGLYRDRALLAGSGDAATHRLSAHDSEATALYNAGRYEWQTRTPVGLTRAVDDFKRAIARDPSYAEAYAGLANCYNLLREYTTMPPQEAYPKAMVAAERAIALNPSLGEAHAALAFDDFYWLRDVPDARREFQAAIVLQPQNASIHHWYATFLMTIREFPQALGEIDKAQALDSASTAILADKGLILFHDGKTLEATALLERLEQTEPTFLSPHQYLSLIYLVRGDDQALLRELKDAAVVRHDGSSNEIADAGVSGYSAGGHEAMFRTMLTAQKRLYLRGKESAYALALAYAELNDKEDAIAYLKVSQSRDEPYNIALAIDPQFASLQNSPAFQTLLSRAGLPSRAQVNE